MLHFTNPVSLNEDFGDLKQCYKQPASSEPYENKKNLTVKIFILQNIVGSKAVFLLILYLGIYAQRPCYFAPPDHSGFAIFRMFFFNNSSIFINNLVASGDNGLKPE